MPKLRELVPSPHTLFVFEAAARNSSFRAAAVELNVTQPSVSHSVRKLEAHIGVKLFTRGNRGVTLSAAGEKLFEDVRKGFGHIQNGFHSVSEKPVNNVTIAASSVIATYWLLPRLEEFQARFPEINLIVFTTDRDLHPASDVTLVFRMADKNLRRNNAWYFADEILFPVCSPCYLEKCGSDITLTDLPNHKLLYLEKPYMAESPWETFMAAHSVGDFNLRNGSGFNDQMFVLQSTLNGRGVAMGHAYLESLLRQGLLVRPVTEFSRNPTEGMFIFGPEHEPLSPAAECVRDWFLIQGKIWNEKDWNQPCKFQ